jgi:Tfp pilus assembly protein PilO
VSANAPFWRRRLLPAFLVLAGTNLVALVGWTGPQYWKQRNAASRAEAGRKELERERRTAAALRERAEAIRATAADVERFYRSLAGVEKGDLLPTLEAIEELARAPGLTPGKRSFRREQVEKARVQQVVVTLPLSGSYEQLVGFLREVEGSPRFLTVDRVAMRADRDAGASLQVELSTYLRRPGEAGREAQGGR